VDGLLIRRTNNYVLRCHACFKISTDTGRVFCHNCGNKTLRRVAVTVDADGTVRYHISQRKKLSARGLRFSLPLPKGGKNSNNPILCEDQKEYRRQPTGKSKVKYDPLSADYIALSSPFAPTDVGSRAAEHRFGGKKGFGAQPQRGRRNPNANSSRRK